MTENTNTRRPETTHLSTSSLETPDASQGPPRLALRPKDACLALGIGERLLWTLTNQGLVPHLRLGKAIVYPVDSLREWLREQATRGGKP